MTAASRDTLREGMIEDGCRAVYGKNWDGPDDKRPGPVMQKVWRDLVAKAQSPLAPILDKADSADRMAGTEEEDDALAEARMDVAFKLVARAKAAEARADRLSAEVEALRADRDLLFEVIGMGLAETAFAVADERDGTATDTTRRVRYAGIRDVLRCVGSEKHRTALARAAVKAETEDRENTATWKPTGSGSAGLNADDGTVEWFRPSDGLVRSFPRHFDPNKGAYSGVTVTTGADLPPAQKEESDA